MKAFLFLNVFLGLVLGLTQCALYQSEEEMKMDEERQVRFSPWAGTPLYKKGLEQAMTDAQKGLNQEKTQAEAYQGQDAQAYKAGYEQGLRSAAASHRLRKAIGSPTKA